MFTQGALNSESTIPTSFKGGTCLFVIEGHDNDVDFNRNFFPDIVAAVELAKANQCDFIDIISSYDEKHLELIFREQDETKLKKIILLLLKRCEGFEEVDRYINEKIKTPCATHGNTTVLNLVSNLNEKNIDAFKEKLIAELAKEQDAAQFSKLLEKELIDLDIAMQAQVNILSAKNLLDYLETNPLVETVYAMVGKDHLKILYLIGKVEEREDKLFSAEIKLSDHTVHAHFFGGIHGDMENYTRLASFVGKQGFIDPLKGQSSTHSTFKFFKISFPSDESEAQFKHVRSMKNELSSFLDESPDLKEADQFKILLNLIDNFFDDLAKRDQLSQQDLSYLSYLESELEIALDMGCKPESYNNKGEVEEGEEIEGVEEELEELEEVEEGDSFSESESAENEEDNRATNPKRQRRK